MCRKQTLFHIWEWQKVQYFILAIKLYHHLSIKKLLVLQYKMYLFCPFSLSFSFFPSFSWSPKWSWHNMACCPSLIDLLNWLLGVFPIIVSLPCNINYMLLLMELNLENVLIILYIHKHKSQRETYERENLQQQKVKPFKRLISYFITAVHARLNKIEIVSWFIFNTGAGHKTPFNGTTGNHRTCSILLETNTRRKIIPSPYLRLWSTSLYCLCFGFFWTEKWPSKFKLNL